MPEIRSRPFRVRTPEEKAAAAGAAPATPQPTRLKPAAALHYLANDPDAVQRAQEGSAAYVYPGDGAANAAFVWWMLNAAGLRLPLNPDPSILVVFLQMAGATIPPPGEPGKAGDLYFDGARLGVVARAGLKGAAFKAVDETCEHGRPYPRDPATVGYYLRLPGG